MRTPQELIEYVAMLIQQKQEKQLPCFYSIKIQKGGATTELIDRKEGNEFVKDVQQIIGINKPESLIVELYRGRSRKVKAPESEFFLDLLGREIAFQPKVESLGGVDQSLVLGEMRRSFEQQLQGIRDLSGLHSTLTVCQLELKHEQQRVKELEGELDEAEAYIRELQSELQGRPQLNGPGGLNLLTVGSYWLEGVLRRNPGIVAGILGIPKDKANTMFASKNEQQQQQNLPQGNQPTGTVKEEQEEKQEELTERDQKRVELIEQVVTFLRALSDLQLRKYYLLLYTLSHRPQELDPVMELLNIKDEQTTKK